MDAFFCHSPNKGGDARATVHLGHIQGWFGSWLPEFAGRGRSPVDAWYTTALDIEECLGGEDDDHVHIFVADVLDCVVSRLGLLGWFRHG